MKREIAAKTIGDAKILTINFGINLESWYTRNVTTKEMGGGALLWIGCYSVMLANLIFGPEKPRKTIASATLLDTGVFFLTVYLYHNIHNATIFDIQNILFCGNENLLYFI